MLKYIMLTLFTLDIIAMLFCMVFFGNAEVIITLLIMIIILLVFGYIPDDYDYEQEDETWTR